MGLLQGFFVSCLSVIIFLCSAPAGAIYDHSLQTVDLRPFLGAPSHQGDSRNTCSAFAATALAEFLLQQQGHGGVALSPSYTYWATRRLMAASPFLKQLYKNVHGAPGFLAVESLSQEGVVLQRRWPYEPHAPQNELPPPGLALESFVFFSEYIQRDRIAFFIMSQQRPVVFNMMWYFAAELTRGEMRLPSLDEQSRCQQQQKGCQGHVVLLVGYDPEKKLFLFRNSWGSQWGDGGYGTLPEQYVLEHCEVCHLLPRIEEYPRQWQEFLRNSSAGVSARLMTR